MNRYYLKDLEATVGKGEDFKTFEEVIDYMLESMPFEKVLKIFGCDGIADLTEVLTGLNGCFSEEAAQDLCMDCLDGADSENEDFKSEWGDQMYDRAVGK